MSSQIEICKIWRHAVGAGFHRGFERRQQSRQLLQSALESRSSRSLALPSVEFCHAGNQESGVRSRQSNARDGVSRF